MTCIRHSMVLAVPEMFPRIESFAPDPDSTAYIPFYLNSLGKLLLEESLPLDRAGGAHDSEQ